jgi:WXG100 family type VII secretion target
VTGPAGAPAVTEFAVDLDELRHVVERMARCEDTMRALAARLSTRVDDLHAGWDGLAATAQHEAQAEWESGFAAMRDGLEQMRDAVRVAHDNYDGAARTNQHLWQQLG